MKQLKSLKLHQNIALRELDTRKCNRVGILKLSDIKLGLLINFNCKMLKEGLHRVVNNL